MWHNVAAYIVADIHMIHKSATMYAALADYVRSMVLCNDNHGECIIFQNSVTSSLFMCQISVKKLMKTIVFHEI